MKPASTLVLLHAFPFDSAFWTPQVAALAASFRVVTPDLLGESIDGSAAKVAAKLDELGITEPVAVCGLSMGGYMAMAFARQFPERLSALILADTKAEADDAKAKEGRAAMITLAKEKGSAGVAEAMLPKMFAAASPDVMNETKAMMSRQPVDKVIAAVEALRDRPDATAGLKAIKVPTLVIVGENDVITPPAMAKIIAENVSAAKLVTIPNAGHLTNLEAPAAFNEAVREFLSAY